MALEGQTPAEVGGVGIEAKNKWLAMLTEAIARDATAGEITPSCKRTVLQLRRLKYSDLLVRRL
jgi:hypothetical protein